LLVPDQRRSRATALNGHFRQRTHIALDRFAGELL
jgi:hypothetical protein